MMLYKFPKVFPAMLLFFLELIFNIYSKEKKPVTVIKQEDEILASCSKELRLLISLLGYGLSDNKHFPEEIDLTQIDWNKFIELVQHHRAKGQIYQSIQKINLNVPTDVTNSLQSLNKTNGIKALKNTGEIYHLAKLLKHEKIPVILFKGIALSQQLYGNTGFRHAGDIDLLIKDTDIHSVDRLLQHIGYTRILPAQDLTPKQLKVFTKHHHHFEYIHKERTIRLEAHWDFFFNKSIYAIDKEMLFADSEEIEISGNTFLTLPQEENILYLMVHGALHGYFRLFWLYDIAYMYCLCENIDWEKIYNKACKAGIERVYTQAFNLISILWSIPIPKFIDLKGQGSSINRLTDTALKTINYGENYFDGSATQRLHKNYYQMILKKGIKYKLSPLLRQFTNYHDWKFVKLPDKFFFLYYVLRPFFIITAFVKKDYFKDIENGKED